MSFYTILNSIERSEVINTFLEDNQIDLDSFNINDIKDVDLLYQTLRLLCLCNCNSFGLLYIFDASIIKENKDMYCWQLEMLIERTYKIKNLAIDFLESIY